MLLRLLQQLKDASGCYDVHVHVLHDGAMPPQYAPCCQWVHTNRPAWSVVSAARHCGKQMYWSLINQLFRFTVHSSAAYYIQLGDDIQVSTSFFSDAISAYESIDDDKKVCLNLINDGRRRCGWVPFTPVRKGHVWHTQWVDMNYIASPTFFRKLNYTLYPISSSRFRDPNISSGVGAQISQRIHRMGLHIYQVDQSLAIHDAHESVMHPEHRKQVPLISNVTHV